MHQIITSNGYTATETIDLDSVLLPGGIKAISLSRDELHSKLTELKIPDISPFDGRQAMILKLARHQRAST